MARDRGLGRRCGVSKITRLYNHTIISEKKQMISENKRSFSSPQDFIIITIVIILSAPCDGGMMEDVSDTGALQQECV